MISVSSSSTSDSNSSSSNSQAMMEKKDFFNIDSEQLESLDIPTECVTEIRSLTDNDDIMGSQLLFVNDILDSCGDPNDKACTVGFDFTGIDITMNACEQYNEQLDNIQRKCQMNNYTYCSVSAIIDADVQLQGILGFPLVAPLTVKPNCFGICVPNECNPETLEGTVGPYDVTIDFVNNIIEELIKRQTELDIDIEKTTISMSFECVILEEDTAEAVEKRTYAWGGR